MGTSISFFKHGDKYFNASLIKVITKKISFDADDYIRRPFNSYSRKPFNHYISGVIHIDTTEVGTIHFYTKQILVPHGLRQKVMNGEECSELHSFIMQKTKEIDEILEQRISHLFEEIGIKRIRQ